MKRKEIIAELEGAIKGLKKVQFEYPKMETKDVIFLLERFNNHYLKK
tara:strand:+ start:709 stop:849 length:141 start_codon:yes stop_codon:yes gene_type:complete